MPPQDTTAAPIIAPRTPLSIGRFAASKLIVKESWAILSQDKEILWFPVLSVISSLLVIGVVGMILLALRLVVGGVGIHGMALDVLVIAGVIAFESLLIFISNFFEAGIYIIADGRFKGQDLSFRDGMSGASQVIWKIFTWSLISATVGVLLRMISDKSKLLGKIVAWIVGAIWSVATYFSLPAIVIGKMGMKDSFTASASAIKKTWGETAIVSLGVGLFFVSIALGLLIPVIGLIFIAQGNLFVIIAAFVAYIIIVAIMSIISSSLTAIYKLALYEYATTGQIPSGFSAQIIENAAKVK
jgi:hypothetical protein